MNYFKIQKDWLKRDRWGSTAAAALWTVVGTSTEAAVAVAEVVVGESLQEKLQPEQSWTHAGRSRGDSYSVDAWSRMALISPDEDRE
jgi:hypothetical protein